MPFDRNVYGSDDPYAIPYDRGVRTDVSGPGFTYDPAGVVLSEEDFQRGLGTTDFGGSDPESLPPEIILQQERERIARQYEDQAMQDEADMPAAGMSDNDLANLELLGYDEIEQILLQDQADTEAEAAVTEAADRARERTARSFENEAEAADAEIAALPRRAREDGDGTGGAGGGAGAGMGGSDDQYDQDKWLALAQFGLSLMSSTAPTFGQALGEAGQTGLQALLSARSARDDRIEAAQARADRIAAAAARAERTGSGFRDDEVDAKIRQSNYLRQRANELRGEGGVFNSPEDEERYNILMDQAGVYDQLIQGATLSQFPEVIAALQN